MLVWIIELSSLAPEQKEGQLTRGVVRKAINARKEGEPADAYAAQVQEDLDNITKLVEQNAGVIYPPTTRRYSVNDRSARYGRSTYKSDMADMLALHDHRAAQASRVDDAMSADLELTRTEKVPQETYQRTQERLPRCLNRNT